MERDLARYQDMKKYIIIPPYLGTNEETRVIYEKFKQHIETKNAIIKAENDKIAAENAIRKLINDEIDEAEEAENNSIKKSSDKFTVHRYDPPELGPLGPYPQVYLPNKTKTTSRSSSSSSKKSRANGHRRRHTRRMRKNRRRGRRGTRRR